MYTLYKYASEAVIQVPENVIQFKESTFDQDIFEFRIILEYVIFNNIIGYPGALQPSLFNYYVY